MELTRSEKLQNLKTYLKRLTKTLSIFNIKESKEEFRKQLHHLHNQAKKMKRQYPQLAIPLKSIITSSLKTDRFNPAPRETLLKRMYVVTREMNETSTYTETETEEKNYWVYNITAKQTCP